MLEYSRYNFLFLLYSSPPARTILLDRAIRILLPLVLETSIAFFGIRMPGFLSRLNGAAGRWQPLLLLGLGVGRIGYQVLYGKSDLLHMPDAESDT